MIRSYRDKDTEYVANGERSRRLPFDIQSAAHRKLRILAAANRQATGSEISRIRPRAQHAA